VAWTADERGLVLGWDSAGREVARHATGVEAIRDMSSAPGALLLSVGGDAAMRLDTRLGTVERIAHAPPGVAWEMASPRGDRVLSIGQGDTIALRVAGEAPGPPRPGGHAHGIIGAVFSPDGSLFATSAADRVVILRTWPDGAERARLVGHSGAVGRGAFTPDGSLLATPSHDGVLLWSTRLGRLQARFTAGLDLHRLTFTPDGRTLVTASGRGAVRTWRIPDWSRHVVADDDMPVRVVAFDATGRLLVAGSRGGLVRVIRVSDGAEVARVHAHDDTAGVNDISIHPSGRLLATAGNEGTVATWTLPGLEPLGRTSPGEREAFCVAWSPDGESLWSGWASGVVLRHDRTLRGPLARVQAHRQGAINLELSDDGGTFVTSSRDRTAKVWDARTLALRHELRVQGAALAADLSPDGLTVATGSDMGRVTIWDARTGLPLSELAGHEHWVVQVAFRPDGRVLASVGLDALRIWDVRSGGQLASTDAVALSVAWSADGSWLATGDLRGAIHFQPIADPASAADVEAILARRRLRRDGMALRDVPP
jgi:WD40 repeat protein